MSEVRHKVTWNGCETCHGAVWTDEHGITACHGHYNVDRVLSGETDGPPDEPGCGWVEPAPSGLTDDERAELARLEAAADLCSMGDRPISPPVKDLRRMWELQARIRSSR